MVAVFCDGFCDNSAVWMIPLSPRVLRANPRVVKFIELYLSSSLSF
jgi:hypothetical protein